MNSTDLVLIFPTSRYTAVPIFHLDDRAAWPPSTRCGIRNADAAGTLTIIQLRHALQYARICQRCRASAGILITEDPNTRTITIN